MSVRMHVVGIRPPDEKWLAMKKIFDACREVDIEPPLEVQKFFNAGPPDDAGVVLRLTLTTCLREWADVCSQGYEIDLDKLPPDIKIIRFYNSW